LLRFQVVSGDQQYVTTARPVNAVVREQSIPPHRLTVAQISAELRIHVDTLYIWKKNWWLQVEVVPAPEKHPEGWASTVKFILLWETAGMNSSELSAYCRESGGPRSGVTWEDHPA